MALLLETLYGDLVIDLDVEGSPELCKNIIQLAYCRYYTNTLIFNVTSQRFCQLGCPIGDGTGGACIYGLIDTVIEQQQQPNFDYKLSKKRFLKSIGRTLTPLECQEKGRVVATLMNFTPNTIGSQFLITTMGGPDHALDGYTQHHNPITTSVATYDSSLTPAVGQRPQFLSLGKVVEDENNVLDKINAAYTDSDGRPYADIRIIRALVIYDPFINDEMIPGVDLLLQSRGVVMDTIDRRRILNSPNPDRPLEETVPKRISAADISIDGNNNEEIYMDDEKYEQERIRQRRIDEEEMAKKVDRSRAVVLEMIGDLPDANIRAPENVLFICKLNPITMDEDLELIFSRFDENVKVEIIRDIDNGNSLQYAFAEFTTEQAAAEAYFKMNNALIDDRRIKVDFSQSVAKLWDRYHQKMKMPKYTNNQTTAKKTDFRHSNHRSGNGNDMNRSNFQHNERKTNLSKHDSEAVVSPRNGYDHRRENNIYDSRTEGVDNRSSYRTEDAFQRKRDRDVDDRVQQESNRNDEHGRRGRIDHFDKADDHKRRYEEHSDEKYRRSYQSDDKHRQDESDDESRHKHRRHRHRSKYDKNHRKSHDDDNVDTAEGKERRHSKKSHRSRDTDDDDDDDSNDRHHRRHHKHKKKSERDNDRTAKYHRRSRSESR